MTETIKTKTLLSLITQQVAEIADAGPIDNPGLLDRLTGITEQLHGIQVYMHLAGMNSLTHPVPKSPPSESSLEDHITRLPPKQQAQADRAFTYPTTDSPEWKQIVDMLRIVKGGKEAETHEVKAAIRGNYPVFQAGDKVRLNGQLTTIVGVELPLELDTWLYKTALNQFERHSAAALERAAQPIPDPKLQAR